MFYAVDWLRASAAFVCQHFVCLLAVTIISSLDGSPLLWVSSVNACLNTLLGSLFLHSNSGSRNPFSLAFLCQPNIHYRANTKHYRFLTLKLSILTEIDQTICWRGGGVRGYEGWWPSYRSSAFLPRELPRTEHRKPHSFKVWGGGAMLLHPVTPLWGRLWLACACSAPYSSPLRGARSFSLNEHFERKQQPNHKKATFLRRLMIMLQIQNTHQGTCVASIFCFR